MDMAMLERDATAALQKFPPGFVKGAVALMKTYDLSGIIPHLKVLAPHVKTIILEFSMGMLEKEELEACLKRVVSKYANPADLKAVP